MNAIDDSSQGALKLRDVYVDELRVHAVTLIWLGHALLDAASFVTAEEDVITGELVKAMKQVMQAPTSPEWVDRYIVQEQVPQNVDGKHGKRRPKMDIEVERHGRGERPKLGFEAKRLRKSHGLRDYLGDEGMTAFLSAYYPTTHGEAGMLGYVQDSSPSDWASRIEKKLTCSQASSYITTDTAGFRLNRTTASPCYESEHSTPLMNRLRVIHVLLPFCS